MNIPFSDEKPANQKAMQHRIQLELLELQSDKKKLDQERSITLDEIKQKERDSSRLTQDIEEKKVHLHSLEREIALINEALVRAKKHLNTL